jgi:hypothetical protein
MDCRFISTLMWFLNVVLPIIGSYYVLNLKPPQPSMERETKPKKNIYATYFNNYFNYLLHYYCVLIYGFKS